MNRPMILITQSGTVTFPAWWWVMRVKGPTIVLEGTPDHRPRRFLVVAELESESEASALFEVINQRISANARKFDTRVSIATLVDSHGRGADLAGVTNHEAWGDDDSGPISREDGRGTLMARAGGCCR